jgi:hypothetical protein
MVSYDSLPFNVLVDDEGRLPRPVRQEDKTLLYSAEISIPISDLTDWESRQSWFTVAPALGIKGGRITVDTGPGALSCTIPQQGAAERTALALLQSITPLADLLGGDFRCEVELVFLAVPA